MASILLIIAFAFSSYGTPTHTFTFRLHQDPDTLDWHGPANVALSTNLMEGLVDFDDQMKPIPCLAKSWKISPDGKTITFELRKQILWSDGVEMTAHDFYFAWNRALSPKSRADAYYLFDIEGARDFYTGKIKDFSKVGVKVLDDYRLQVKLSRPVPFWPSVTAFQTFFPMREDVVKKYGTNWATPGKMVTLGPFMLESMTPGKEVVMIRNPHYHRGSGNIEKVVAMVLLENRTAMNLFENGKLDFISRIDDMDGKTLAGAVRMPMFRTMSLQINVLNPAVQNKHLRRALAMAIDKTKLPALVHEAEQVATAWVPPSLFRFKESIGLPYDPARAKQELAKSGFDVEKSPPLVFILNANNAYTVKIAEYLQQELKKNLGLRTDLQLVDHGVIMQLKKDHRHPLYFMDWTADYPDPDSFLGTFLSGSGQNNTGYASSALDEEILSAREDLNPKRRTEKYVRLQKQLQEEEAVEVPLYYGSQLAFISKRVKGAKISPLLHFSLKDATVDN